MAPLKRDAVLNVRLPEEVKAALQRAADDDHGRSLSALTVRVLREWLEQHAYINRTARAR